MFLISDNGKNFSHLAREFNCHYEHATENVSVKGPNWKWRAWLKRIELMNQYFPKEYFILMEPDVYINASHPMLADCNSTRNSYNQFKWGFCSYICRLHLSWTYPLGYSCGGGSVFRTQALLQSATAGSDAEIETMARLDPRVNTHNDAFCAAIMFRNNCAFYYHSTVHFSIVHNFKRYYS